jgi:predicted ester cyclase
MRDVLDGHRGDHAVRYLTSGMSWHSGTVGTVAGRDNVAGLMTTVVTGIPDLHADVKDIFGEGNEVVVRLVVSGTLKGDLLGVHGTGQHVQWDAIDLYHLQGGKISEEWAGEDYVAFLNDSGTYKAPWIS